jgi:hypothetical protein
VVVGGDVGREQLCLTGLVLRALHGIVHQGHHLLHRCKNLVALRFVILDEVAAQPELVGSLGKRLRTQTEFRLDDRAGNIAAILDRATQDPPQVGDVLGRAVKKLNGTLGHVEIVDFGVLDVAHALVVADHQRQERYDHHPPVGDVTVEKVQRVGDAHLFARPRRSGRPGHRRRG